jgi:hypothetical protein
MSNLDYDALVRQAMPQIKRTVRRGVEDRLSRFSNWAGDVGQSFRQNVMGGEGLDMLRGKGGNALMGLVNMLQRLGIFQPQRA